MFKPLKLDQFIDITTSGIKSNKYACKVKDIMGERIFVLVPDEFIESNDVIPGTKVKVSFSDNAAVYTFYSEIIVLKPGKPYVLVLGRPINMNRIQRRNFVRLSTRLTVFSSKLDKDNQVLESFSATTTDISGGGILFGCDHPLNIGDMLETFIYIGDNQTVVAVGRVVRAVEQSAASKYRYVVGLEFENIRENERDKIIKYIFNQQRELRTKGLL